MHIKIRTQRKIIQVILLNFRSKLGLMDKSEISIIKVYIITRSIIIKKQTFIQLQKY